MIFNLDVVMKNMTVTLDSKYPEDATVTAGQDVSFKAAITDEGHPKEYTLQWYVNGTAIEDATGETYTRSTSSDKGVLSVWCEASNKAGTATSRHATLTVKKAPVLDASYPKDASVYVTENATFEAKVAETGYPDSYTYQWYKNGEKVEGETKSSYSVIQSTEGTTTVYCEVTNDAGTVKTRTATMTANRVYLYNYGDTCDAVTGGWVPARWSSGSSDGYVNCLELNADHMKISGRYNQYCGGCGTANAIDLSNHTKLNALVVSGAGTDQAVMCIAPGLDRFGEYRYASVLLPYPEQVISLDVSFAYLSHVAISSDTGDAVIKAVWLG